MYQDCQQPAMTETKNQGLVRSFLPVEKPKMTKAYENEIFINID
jgi:hypothetical protein